MLADDGLPISAQSLTTADRQARVSGTAVLPPQLPERAVCWIYRVMATAPLAAVVFLPLPPGLEGLRGLWLAAGALLSARMWLRDFSLRRLTRWSRFLGYRQPIYLLPFAAALIFTPTGDWLAGLWRDVPFLVGTTGGLVLAGIAVVGWYVMESDVGLLPLPPPLRILIAIVAPLGLFRVLLFRGVLPFLLVAQVLPDRGLLTATVYLLAAELVVLAIDTLVTKNLRSKISDAAQFPGQVKALGDYIVGSWVYDAVVARPSQPDYSFIAALVGQAELANSGSTLLQKLSSRKVTSGLKRPADTAIAWLDIADFAVDVVEFRVMPGFPDHYLPALRREHFRSRGLIASSRSSAYRTTGRYDEGVSQRFAAAEAFDKAGLPSWAAFCRCLAAQVLLMVFNRTEEAFRLIVDVIEGNKEIALPVARDAFMLAGLCMESLGLREEAKRNLEVARKVPIDPKDVEKLIYELGMPASPLFVRPLVKNMADMFRVHEGMLAEALGEEGSSPLLPDSPLVPPDVRLLEKAHRLQSEGRSAEARKDALRVVKLAERQDNMTELALAHWLLADLAEEERDWATCYRHLTAAVDASEARRSRVLDPNSRAEISTTFYWPLVRLLTDRHRNRSAGLPERPLAKAFDVAEQSRSRVLLELLGQSFAAAAPIELRDLTERERKAEAAYVARRAATREARRDEAPAAFDEERRAWENLTAVWAAMEATGPAGAAYASARRGQPMNYAEVRELLKDLQQAGHGVLLAEYFRAGPHTTVFLARAEYLEPIVVTVEHRIREHWLDAIEPFQAPPTVLDVDPQTWDVQFRPLVQPLVEHSSEGDLIWLVLDGVLHYVPLHAVTVDGRPLTERNPVCVTPSASVMRYCLSHGVQSRLRSGLLLADSRADRPLVHARVEARTSANALPDGGEVYVGAEVNKAVLARRLSRGRYDVLHIACHGEFDYAQPMRSGILLAPSPGEDDHEARLTGEDLLGMQLPVRLVTLSACDSGLSDADSGNELVGLVRALLHAGTPSVLVTLWSVDEISSSILMQAFYRAIGQGMGRAEALRTAQRTVRTTTVAEALGYCDSALSHLDENDTVGQIALRWDVADLHYRARDFLRASDMYQALLADVEPGSEDQRKLLIASARCRRATGSGLLADHGLPAFDHPYYWAAFQLVGDWR